MMARLRIWLPAPLAAIIVFQFASFSASAQQSWLPVISSAQAAPSGIDEPEADGPELDQSWFPVLIRPPQIDEADDKLAQAAKTRPQNQGKVDQAVNTERVMAAPKQTSSVRPTEPKSNETTLAEEYCVNIADAAADARVAWQKRTLSEMEQEIENRITILETRTAEYRDWLARRDAFVEKAKESLVRIFSRMRPDAAAAQLGAMDEETAAAVLTKLNPRNASAILNEMPPARAARLTTTIAGAAKTNPAQSPDSGGGRT